MSKTVETTITRFDGGITDDPRDTRDGVSQITTNFNALASPFRLVPYRETETGNSAQTTKDIRNFCIADETGSGGYALFGLGVTSGTSQAEIYYKDLTTGSANDLDDGDWAENSNNATGGGTVNYNTFYYYPQTGYLYCLISGTHVCRIDPDGGDAIATTHQALTYSDNGQGLVHSKDDIAYIPYFNSGGYIASDNNGTWNTTALTLPKHYNPVSICEYGNFLAIGCRHIDGVSNSRVFLWDRDSSLTTLTESIDWGEGKLAVLEEVDGVLVGISQVGNNQANSFDRIIFRAYEGNQARKFKEFLTGGASSQLPRAKQKIDNRLYFMMQVSLYGATREGVWSVGRTPGQPLTVVHELTPNNDTALSSGVLRGFFKVGEYMFQAFATSSTETMTKTSEDTSSAGYSATAIYESKIFNDGDTTKTKILKGVTALHEYLPSGAQIVVKYKVDNETSFTTILTSSTAGDVSKSAVNIESSGAELPHYKEITWRIESTGNAVPTGLSWKSEILDDRPY